MAENWFQSGGSCELLPVDENSIEGDGGTVCKEHPGGALRDSITLTFNGANQMQSSCSLTVSFTTTPRRRYDCFHFTVIKN